MTLDRPEQERQKITPANVRLPAEAWYCRVSDIKEIMDKMMASKVMPFGGNDLVIYAGEKPGADKDVPQAFKDKFNQFAQGEMSLDELKGKNAKLPPGQWESVLKSSLEELSSNDPNRRAAAQALLNAVAKDLIKDLGSEEYPRRELASDRLAKIGLPIQRLLRAATNADDLEVRRRAQDLVGAVEAHRPLEVCRRVADISGDRREGIEKCIVSGDVEQLKEKYKLDGLAVLAMQLSDLAQKEGLNSDQGKGLLKLWKALKQDGAPLCYAFLDHETTAPALRKIATEYLDQITTGKNLNEKERALFLSGHPDYWLLDFRCNLRAVGDPKFGRAFRADFNGQEVNVRVEIWSKPNQSAEYLLDALTNKTWFRPEGVGGPTRIPERESRGFILGGEEFDKDARWGRVGVLERQPDGQDRMRHYWLWGKPDGK